MRPLRKRRYTAVVGFRRSVLEQQPPAPRAPVRCRPVPFTERRHNQCSYPLWGNDEPTGDVCGLPIKQGTLFRFCEYHYACACGSPMRQVR